VNPRYEQVARRADHRCEYCRAPERAFNSAFEVEHVYPSARGGSDDPTNLALACRACNARKGDTVRATDPVTGEEVELYNPRTDRWHTHFQYDPDRHELVGLTPTGRATVVRLELNGPHQLTARALWVKVGFFP
jgi:hypothetical protein